MQNIYDTLGFTIHRACNAACSICCFSSSPACEEKLNVKRIKEYIDESKDIPEIKTIAFTGGIVAQLSRQKSKIFIMN